MLHAISSVLISKQMSQLPWLEVLCLSSEEQGHATLLGALPAACSVLLRVHGLKSELWSILTEICLKNGFWHFKRHFGCIKCAWHSVLGVEGLVRAVGLAAVSL